MIALLCRIFILSSVGLGILGTRSDTSDKVPDKLSRDRLFDADSTRVIDDVLAVSDSASTFYVYAENQSYACNTKKCLLTWL